MAAAMSDHAAALGTVATQAMAHVATGVMRELAELRALEERREQAERERWQAMDARLDTFGVLLRRVDDLERRVARLEAARAAGG